MEAWVGVGTLLLDGYQENPQPNMLRTDMDGGVAKQRPQSSLEIFNRPVSFLFTQAEFIAFKEWRRGTVNNGADWFTMDDPLDGVNKNFRMVKGGYTTTMIPAGRDAPLKIKVSMTLETVE